jgi:hypothetical protein
MIVQKINRSFYGGKFFTQIIFKKNYLKKNKTQVKNLKFYKFKNNIQFNFLRSRKQIKKYEKYTRKLGKWENFIQQNKINFSEFSYSKNVKLIENKSNPSKKIIRKRFEVLSKERKFFGIIFDVKDTINSRFIKELLSKTIFQYSSIESYSHSHVCEEQSKILRTKKNKILIFNGGVEFNRNPFCVIFKKG